MNSQVLVEAAGRAIGALLADIADNQEKYCRAIKKRAGVTEDAAQLGVLHGVIVLSKLRNRGWVPKKGDPAAYPKIVAGYFHTTARREAIKTSKRKINTVPIDFDPVAPSIGWNLPVEDACRVVEKYGSDEQREFFEQLLRLESAGLGPGSSDRIRVLQKAYGLERSAIRDRIKELQTLLAKHLLEIQQD